jgi:hypothetical protein
MKPLLTPPGLDATPIETAIRRNPARPPLSVQTLQVLLLAAAAAVVAIWLWTWNGVQAYAWPGVDNGLTARGLAYLLILAPAVPVNLLAAIWLARGGRRAQLYLAAAGALVIVQTMLLLTPTAMPLSDAMSDGAATVGIRFLIVMGPFLFAGAWIASATPARTWLGVGPARAGRLLGAEAAVWCLALALAIGMGTEVHEWAETAAEPEAPRGEYTEAGTWERLELLVTETTDAIPNFQGFTARTLDVVPCGYTTPAGLSTYRYDLTYELREAADEPIASRWAADDFSLTYDGETLEGNRLITAERTYAAEGDTPHTITLDYTEDPAATLHLQSPCAERTGTPECLESQGNPIKDTIIGITCPRPN